MDTSKTLVCFFIITVFMMGTSTNAQTTETTTTAGGTTAVDTTAVGTAVGTAALTVVTTERTTGAGGATEAATTGGATTAGGNEATRDAMATAAADNATTVVATGDATTEVGTAAATTRQPSQQTTPMTTVTPGTRLEFDGKFQITQIGGLPAVFEDDLTNSASAKYKDLRDTVCISLKAALNGSSFDADFMGCDVNEFTEGSIIASFRMAFVKESKVSAEALKTQLVTAFTNPTDPRIAILTVDTKSFEVAVVTSSGLSTGAIVGIAVGSAAAVALVIIIIVVVIKVNGKSDKVSSVEDAELQPVNKETNAEAHSNSVASVP